MNASNSKIVVTAENVLNLTNVDLGAFLKANAIEGFSRVSKANRDAAEKVAKEFFAKVTSAEGATDGRNTALDTSTEGAFNFPRSASTAVVTVAPEGWTSVEGGGSDAEAEQEARDAKNAESGESEAEAAARIEAEAAAESADDTDEAKAARKARANARASNSVGVALSWRNPEVRAARLVRDGVSVSYKDENGNELDAGQYKSVAEAFRALRLPFEKHIKFRLALKASRREDIKLGEVVYTFTM